MSHKKFLKHVAVAAIPAIALVIHACTQPLTLEDVLVRPESMSAVGATAFNAIAGSVVQNPAKVRVLDQTGEPLPNQSLTFAASRGTLSDATASTNADGEANPASWTAPTLAGSATITASVPAEFSVAPVVFNVTVTAAAPATQTAGTGTTPQSAIAGQAVGTAPEVRVVDQFGNGNPGVVVTFTVLTGGGTLNGSSATTANVTTDANGSAKLTSWVLGPAVGTNNNTLGATTSVLPTQPVTFTASGTVGPPNKIVIAPPGNSQGQSAVRGTNVGVAPAVLVTDANNNPISGLSVRFSIALGGGKVIASDASQVAVLNVPTNASGIATTNGWLLWEPGANTITVTVPSATGVAPFTISATGTPAPPANIVLEDPNADFQFAAVGTAVDVPPGVIVKDSDNFVVAGTSVTFTVGANSGTIKTTLASSPSTTANVTTDANGVARLFSWTLANRGPNTLAASVTSNTNITLTFNASGTAGPPASIEIFAGNNQSVVANTATLVPPAALVRDANGLTVDDGYEITFTITNGGGVVSATGCTGSANAATVATDVNGVATLGCWKPGTVGVNANTVRATIDDLPAVGVNFTATGTTGPPAQVTYTNLPWPYTRISTANLGVPKVRVTDAGGNPLSGQTIAWTPGTNSTVTGPGTSTTSGTGEATWPAGAAWNANGAVGATMQLNATVQATAITAQTTSLITNPPNVIVQVTAPPAATTVNLNVSPNPVLETRDTDGRPAPGAPLSWAYTVNPAGTSPGSLSGSPATTDSVGRATPGTWKVSNAPGTNTIQATLVGPNVTVTHTTTGVAGPAANIGVNTGNGQTAPTSTAVTTPPSVVVRDAFGNLAGSGVSVTFQPVSGSGSVTGTPAITNSSSIATVGSWTLGATPGTQTLNAYLTANTGVLTSFTATATDPCAATAFTVGGATVNGSLAVTDCSVTNVGVTRYADFYQFTVPVGPSRLMSATLNGSTFGPQLRSQIYPPSTAYWYNEQAAAGSVVSNYVLGPGTYLIAATSTNALTSGNYSLSSVLNPPMPTGCGDFLVTKNISVTTHTLQTGNCLYTYSGGTAQVPSRRYLLYLPANESATVNVSGASIDWYLEAYDVTSTATLITAQDDEGTGIAESMIIASTTANRFIEIRVAQWQLQSPAPAPGSYTYTLSIP